LPSQFGYFTLHPLSVHSHYNFIINFERSSQTKFHHMICFVINCRLQNNPCCSNQQTNEQRCYCKQICIIIPSEYHIPSS
jgi:hypothetical protein